MKVNITKSFKNLARVYRQKFSYQTGLNISKASNIFLTLTHRCNFRCENCAIWKLPKKKELTTAEWIKIARRLQNWMKFGTITLNGGEPLLRTDIFEIIKKIKTPDFYLTLNSNGYAVGEKIAEKIARSGIDEIKISFYSLKAKVHDKLRGIVGAFDQAQKAINYLIAARKKSKAKMVISIGVLVTKENLEEIPKMAKWADDKNICLILQALDEEFEIQQIGSQSQKWWEKCPSWPKDKKKIKKIFLEISALKNENFPILNSRGLLTNMEEYYLNPASALKINCLVGEQNIIVDPYGKVRFCFRGDRIGDLKNQDISDVWCCQAAKRERKIIKKCRLACRIINCNYSVGFKDRIVNFLKRINQ